MIIKGKAGEVLDAVTALTDTPAYDPWNLDHVRARRAKHRMEVHGEDRSFDCVTCGALDGRLRRLEKAFEESQKATKQ